MVTNFHVSAEQSKINTRYLILSFQNLFML